MPGRKTLPVKPWEATPPPLTAELPLTVQLVSVALPNPLVSRPPPLLRPSREIHSSEEVDRNRPHPHRVGVQLTQAQ